MASFSSSAKAEVCRDFPPDAVSAAAECFGCLLFGNSFRFDGIRLITESREFGKMLPKLFRKAFGFGFDQQPDGDAAGKLVFQITDGKKLETIMETFGFSTEDTLSLHINLSVVEDESSKAYFLRGAFLSGGSVTDPEKGYHMELTTTHQSVARECDALIREVLGFAPKTAARGGSRVLYLKQSERISDFLTYLGAPVAAMGIMEARLEKELNNRVNRCCNCDDANTSKVVDAAQEQLAAIRCLRSSGQLEQLPPKLQLAAKAREENPEAALVELAAMMEPPITKPAMSHRLRRLIELAKETQI